MFIGVYWDDRSESENEVCTRLSSFLLELRGMDGRFQSWFRLGKTKAEALSASVNLDLDSMARNLERSRDDVEGRVIAQLGYSISLWNGGGVSFSAALGCSSLFVANRAVLSFSRDDKLLPEKSRRVFEAMIARFEPERGAVTSHRHLTTVDASDPCDSGYYLYTRDRGLVQREVEL